MTRAEAKKLVCHGMAVTLHRDLHELGAEWIFGSEDDPRSDEDVKKLVAAAEELVTELHRRGRGMRGAMKPGDCVGSGFCCKKAPCGYAAHNYDVLKYWGEGKPGCPDLEWDAKEERYWCGMVRKIQDPSRKEFVMEDLAMGAGCCCSLFNSAREKILAKLRSSSSASGP
jgi:hypothetical protein